MSEFNMPKYVYKDKPISMDDCYEESSGMTYESPINIMYQGTRAKIEGDILEAIHSYGVYVDKDELIKALQYDRDQYRKGFADGRRGRANKVESEVAREIFDLIEDECLAYPIQEGHPTILVDARNYNELKKKYTEEK